MPFQSPSLNSYKMQRAHRMNRIEDVKLRNDLCVLQKDRAHALRLTNQDIRMLNVTMDVVQFSSGHSPEGRPPDYQEESSDDDGDDVAFMYGERTPRYSSARRVKSAPTGRLSSLPVSAISTARSSRPSTGRSANPAQGKTQLARRAQTAGIQRSTAHSRSTSPSRSKSPFSRKAFHQDDIRKQISSIKGNHNHIKGQVHGKTMKKKRPFSSFGPSSIDSDDEKYPEKRPEPTKERAVSAKLTRQPSMRNSAITQAVRETRAMTSSNVKRSQMTPEQAWVMTQPMSQKKQHFKENLMELNALKISRVENRMRDFLSKYPIIVKS